MKPAVFFYNPGCTWTCASPCCRCCYLVELCIKAILEVQVWCPSWPEGLGRKKKGGRESCLHSVSSAPSFPRVNESLVQAKGKQDKGQQSVLSYSSVNFFPLTTLTGQPWLYSQLSSPKPSPLKLWYQLPCDILNEGPKYDGRLVIDKLEGSWSPVLSEIKWGPFIGFKNNR